ncbi:hypothetical protein [Rhizobium halophilum]|uniref:hypothetical protein n=1 Tax=Rhizobium halophilum TaxID=2846852 RepID=UPI001EFEA975|nr:hypothetical protein [Rhizobium halophilum]
MPVPEGDDLAVIDLLQLRLSPQFPREADLFHGRSDDREAGQHHDADQRLYEVYWLTDKPHLSLPVSAQLSEDALARHVGSMDHGFIWNRPIFESMLDRSKSWIGACDWQHAR